MDSNPKNYFEIASKPRRALADADGAITVLDGWVIITKATACALTLADPPADATSELKVVCATTAAHTVTAASPFDGTNSVVTFSTIGECARFLAHNGGWILTDNNGGVLSI